MKNYTTEWDFSLIYKSEADFNEDIKSFKSLIEDVKKFEGKLTCEAGIIEYLKLTEKMMKIIYRLDFYVSLKVDKNNKDSKSLKNYGEIMNLITDYSVATAYVQPELATNSDEFLLSLKNNVKYKEYSRFFESIIKEKKHTISKDKEELMAGISNFTDYNEIFDRLSNNEIVFEDVIMRDGTVSKLNDSTYGMFIKNKDKDIRKQANEKLLKGYSNFNLTISQIYIDYLKKKDFTSKTYKYKSAFDSACFGAEIDEKVYFNLTTQIKKHLPDYQNYLKVKAKRMGVPTLLISDVSAPIGESDAFSYSYEEAVDLVLDTVSVLGENYKKVATNMFTGGVIDVYPKEGKQSGAYSSSAQTGHQFMLLNYNKTYNDVSTIAHELGHSMHSYFSEKSQPYFTQRYEIFVAEIASTVNEILLAKKMLSKVKTDEEKLFIVDSLLSEFCATVFRQTMFSDFEYYAHSEINQGKAISYEDLNNKYNDLLDEYFKDSVIRHSYSKYEWSRIPHFYRAFYVYKYATGFISAVSIANKIEKYGKDYVEKHYLKFLSAGSSLDPVSILKLADVDITSANPYNEAFEFFNGLVNLIR